MTLVPEDVDILRKDVDILILVTQDVDILKKDVDIFKHLLIFFNISSSLKLVVKSLSRLKMSLLSGFEFLTLGGVFLGVKINSKNFGNKINIGLFCKILSKGT